MSRNGHVLSDEELFEIQKRLGVSFNNPELLREALSESRYWNGRRDHYKWIEFVGDRLIGLATSVWLLKSSQGTVTEKERLARLYDVSVSNKTLSELSLKLGLCESSNGADTGKNPANTFEMVAAYIFLDQGLDAVMQFLERTLFVEMPRLALLPSPYHPKTALQIRARQLFGKDPEYKQIGTDGRGFVSCVVYIGAIRAGMGRGQNAREASAEAAKEALSRLMVLRKKLRQCDSVSRGRRWKR